MVFLITVIAIILIFIEAGGWSVAPELPQKAHPILGIIIFVCIIINVSTVAISLSLSLIFIEAGGWSVASELPQKVKLILYWVSSSLSESSM